MRTDLLLKTGQISDGTGLVISSSRVILYASSGAGFAAARAETLKLREQINYFRKIA